MTLALLFAEQWSHFLEHFGFLNDRLLAELESCWRDSQSVLENQARRLDALALPDAEQVGLAAYQRALEEASRKLLAEPLSQWDRKRPYRRALRAIETYDRGLEDLARSLPESVSVNGSQAISLLGEWAPGGTRKRLAHLRRKERPMPLKAIVVGELRRLSLMRLKTEGQYLLTLILTLHQLKRPGEIAHSALSTLARGQALSDEDWTAQREGVKTSVESLIKQAESDLSAWRQWPDITVRSLAKRILAAVVCRRQKKLVIPEARRAAYLNHWLEQRRAVETEVQLELAVERFESRIPSLFLRGLENLDLERTDLLAELDGFIAWLRSRTEENRLEESPAPKSDVISAISRLSEMTDGMKAELNNVSQEREIISRFFAAPLAASESENSVPEICSINRSSKSGARKSIRPSRI